MYDWKPIVLVFMLSFVVSRPIEAYSHEYQKKIEGELLNIEYLFFFGMSLW